MTNQNKKQKQKKEVRCKKCNSKQVYIRIKENSRVCRHCGHINPIGELDEQN